MYLQGSPWNHGAQFRPRLSPFFPTPRPDETNHPTLCTNPTNPPIEDLARACAGQAQAIFIAADFQAADIERDQDRILLTAVAARKYLIRCVFWPVCVCVV